MDTMATHIPSWGLKVGRLINHRKKNNIGNKQRDHQKVGETVKKTQRNKNTHSISHMAHGAPVTHTTL